MFGETYTAAGNVDFVSEDLQRSIDRSKMIEASATNDKYSVAICCFLLLGDANGQYLASSSSEELSIKQRHQLIEKHNYLGKAFVCKLMHDEITAVDASLKFHELLLITGEATEM